MNKTPAITVRNISKKYYIGHNTVTKGNMGFLKSLALPYKVFSGSAFKPKDSEKSIWALKDISFDIYKGEKVGVIGRNGAGKSTLLKILSRLVYPTEGEARIRGRVTSLLGIGTGFNPLMSGRENIYINASLHGLKKPEIDAKFDDIVDFADIRRFIDTPVKYYSNGMHSRLAFAVAAHLDPDILMLDEVLSVGDMAFQKKSLKKVEGMTAAGRTVLFVSHSMDAVMKFCNRAFWLDEGRLVMDGDVEDVTNEYAIKVLKVSSSKNWEHKSGGDKKKDASNTDEAENEATNETANDTANETEETNAVKDAESKRPDEPKDGESVEPSAPNAVESPSENTDETAPNEAEVKTEEPQPEKPDQTEEKSAEPAADDKKETEKKEENGNGDIIENEYVRMLAIRAVNREGKTITSIRVDRPVGVELKYEVLKGGKVLLPGFRFYSSQGVFLFTSVCTDTEGGLTEKREPGQYSTTVWIPEHFLNTGNINVSVSITTPSSPLERHVVLENIISFTIYDVALDEYSAKGMYRFLPGAVRPLLKWDNKTL